MHPIGIPQGAANAINDLLDNCARIKAGDDVVLLAHLDGLYGGDNLVDPLAISWIQAAIRHRNANASILWIDETPKKHNWRVPRIFEAALKACDVFINHSFDLTIEEQSIIQEIAIENNTNLVRNFATTPGLLNSAWAQTPFELVDEIRFQAGRFFKTGLPFELMDDKGTHLTGTIAAPNHPLFSEYQNRRWDASDYHPFPEWVITLINIAETNGIVVFSRMLSWWSRYIGIPPFFKKPIRLTIENNKITNIEGGEEAQNLKKFLQDLKRRLGDGVYGFPHIHTGVHPNTKVGPQQVNNPLHRRIIEHSGSNCIHMHIGAPQPTEEYPYWLHITADVLNATWRVGNQLVHDRGHLTVLDDPAVLAVAEKYPDRPGLQPWPSNF